MRHLTYFIPFGMAYSLAMWALFTNDPYNSHKCFAALLLAVIGVVMLLFREEEVTPEQIIDPYERYNRPMVIKRQTQGD